MKVLFLTNVPAPYRVDFFNELGKMCELTVLFEKTTSDERDNSWRNYQFEHFKGVFLRGKSIDVDSAVCPEVIKYLKPCVFDHIIVANFLSPTGMLAILWMRMKKMGYWLESDGGFAKDGVGLKEKIKTFFIKGAKGYFSTAVEHDKYYMQYGAPAEKIYRYPFTSLKQTDVFQSPADLEEKELLRQKLAVREKYMVLSVGRFSYLNGYGKGYDAMIRAAQRLPQNIGWYIVGGTPTEEFAEIVRNSGLINIHFVDFVDKGALKEYYRAADVFALMTVSDVWGLVINEAMACGLPVITTDKCVAGLELVAEDKNGYIVPVGGDEALADRLKRVLADPAKVEEMGKKSLELIQEYTIENMAEKHIEAFERIKKRNKNEDSY